MDVSGGHTDLVQSRRMNVRLSASRQVWQRAVNLATPELTKRHIRDIENMSHLLISDDAFKKDHVNTFRIHATLI